MCPRLLEIGPFTIYSYGLMLAMGFIVASYLLTLELKRKNLDPNLGNNVTLIALIGGIAGSKILFLLEHFNLFIADPIGMAFSPSGLTFYGGFILATILIYSYVKKKGIKFFTIADSVSPGLLLGYGIARIGCHLSGDGDYGFPTTLPWGTNYSKGTYPPSAAFKSFPEITSQFPNGIVPDNTLCHPTPVYEFLLCAVLFAVMWRLRKNLKPDGKMFMLYLLFAGAERFTIEFSRLNPRLAFGLSEAQLIALALVALGLYGWNYFSKKDKESKPI
ncbi:MAG: prolipoprotein diacylglyceryl transferase [Ignavibacteriales bacterium]|nr:prolipoprotein diacylglyceryl transferase [Ignavibacteriales bacterium]